MVRVNSCDDSTNDCYYAIANNLDSIHDDLQELIKMLKIVLDRIGQE